MKIKTTNAKKSRTQKYFLSIGGIYGKIKQKS